MLQRVAIGVVTGLLLLFGMLAAVGELSGEVVVLYTRDGAGEWRKTRLWVVDYEGDAWIRAGGRATLSDSSWFARLTLDPQVRLERDGETADFNAVPTPAQQRVIHQRMREAYPLADRLIRALHALAQSGEDDPSVPIRLEPLAEAARASSP